MDITKRPPYYWRIQQILHDQLPILETVRQQRYASWKNSVENYQPKVWGRTSRSGSNSGPTEHLGAARTSKYQADDTMTRFLIRRLLNMIPLILGITFISFLAMSLVPGDFVSNLKLNPTITPEVIHQLEAQFGLDQPLMVRYFKWLWGVLHLNFGFSLQYRVSVTGLIEFARRQHDYFGGYQHDFVVADRDPYRHHRRGESEFDLGSLPLVPGVLRDVGAELSFSPS